MVISMIPRRWYSRLTTVSDLRQLALIPDTANRPATTDEIDAVLGPVVAALKSREIWRIRALRGLR